MATLIISLVYGGLDINDTPLLTSLEETGYAGEICIMNTEEDIGNRARMFAYRNALEESDPRLDTVILTDARDVLFQRDPTDIPHGELDVYLEDESKTLGNCEINNATFLDEYGADELAKVKDRPVSCAGVVIGTFAGIHRYLDRFCAEVKACRPGIWWSQPLHNYLLWNDELDPVNVVENERAPVYTVGQCEGVQVSGHKILNRAGEVPFMVHQFDRHLAAL